MSSAPAAGPYGSPRRSEWLDVDWERHRHTATVDGAPINYLELGEGPSVLLIHGLSGSWESWLENIPALARDFRVLAVDLPGFGHSALLPGELSIPAYARFVDAFLEEVQVARAALVGSSMGGLVAADTAATFPDRVTRLVLVAAPGPGRRAAASEEVGAPGIGRAVLGSLARRSGWLLRNGAVRRALLGRLIRYPERISPQLLGRLAAGVARPASLVARRATVRNDVGTRVGAIAAPTLLVWGADDEVVPPYVAEYYEQALPDSRKVIFPDTAHAPMIERPQSFNLLVKEFLESP